MFHISKYNCMKGFVSHSYEYQVAIKLFFNLFVLFHSVRKRQRRILRKGVTYVGIFVLRSYRTQFSKYPMQKTARMHHARAHGLWGPGIHKTRWTPPDARARSSVSWALLRSSWRVGHEARRPFSSRTRRCSSWQSHLSRCEFTRLIREYGMTI
jgi:hypothetical protein